MIRATGLQEADLRCWKLCPWHAITTAPTVLCSCFVHGVVFDGTEPVDDSGAVIIRWLRPSGITTAGGKQRKRVWYRCDANCVDGAACKQRGLANRQINDVKAHRLHGKPIVKLPPASARLLKHKRAFSELDEPPLCTQTLPSGKQIGHFEDVDGDRFKTRWFCTGSCGQRECEFSKAGYLDKHLVVDHIEGASASAAGNSSSADAKSSSANSSQAEKSTRRAAPSAAARRAAPSAAKPRVALADITNLRVPPSAAQAASLKFQCALRNLDAAL